MLLSYSAILGQWTCCWRKGEKLWRVFSSIRRVFLSIWLPGLQSGSWYKTHDRWSKMSPSGPGRSKEGWLNGWWSGLCTSWKLSRCMKYEWRPNKLSGTDEFAICHTNIIGRSHPTHYFIRVLSSGAWCPIAESLTNPGCKAISNRTKSRIPALFGQFRLSLCISSPDSPSIKIASNAFIKFFPGNTTMREAVGSFLLLFITRCRMYSCKTSKSGVKNTENHSKIESTQQHGWEHRNRSKCPPSRTTQKDWKPDYSCHPICWVHCIFRWSVEPRSVTGKLCWQSKPENDNAEN